MKTEDIQNDISEIRRMMEESTQIFTLSGLSGIFVGIIALISASIAYYYVNIYLVETNYAELYQSGIFRSEAFIKLSVLSLITMIASLAVGFYFTYRKSQVSFKEKFATPNSKKFLIDLFIPLAIGGLFCLIAVYHQLYLLIAPITLLFYGMSLISGGSFSIREIRQLGVLQCIVGLASFIHFEFALIYWAFGFGFLHIIYGIIIYMRYDR